MLLSSSRSFLAITIHPSTRWEDDYKINGEQRRPKETRKERKTTEKLGLGALYKRGKQAFI